MHNSLTPLDLVNWFQQSSLPRSEISSNDLGLFNSLLSWDSNEDFRGFCFKIGISFNSSREAGNFFNLVRSQQSLPSVKLDDNLECIEHLKALCFASNM